MSYQTLLAVVLASSLGACSSSSSSPTDSYVPYSHWDGASPAACQPCTSFSTLKEFGSLCDGGVVYAICVPGEVSYSEYSCAEPPSASALDCNHD
jgi:hypothetical protein